MSSNVTAAMLKCPNSTGEPKSYSFCRQALGEHPLVGDTRMVGLMGAFEIVKSKDPLQRFAEKRGAGTAFRDTLMGLGVCMRAVGDTIICAPPFVLSHQEADEMIDQVWQALDLTQKTLSA